MDKFRKSRYGVLIISHGSKNEEWVKLVEEAVQGVDCKYPLECAFLEFAPERDIPQSVSRLIHQQAAEIIAIPLFVSSGSGHVSEIGAMLRQIEETEHVPIHYMPPLHDADEVAWIIKDKVTPMSLNPQEEVLLLIGHGSKEERAQHLWLEQMGSLARKIQPLTGFHAVDYALLLPERSAERLTFWNEAYPDKNVIIFPLFLSKGYFTDTVIPERLKGLKYRYCNQALLPSPLISEFIQRVISKFG